MSLLGGNSAIRKTNLPALGKAIPCGTMWVHLQFLIHFAQQEKLEDMKHLANLEMQISGISGGSRGQSFALGLQ